MKPLSRNSSWMMVQQMKAPITMTMRCSRMKSMTLRIVLRLGFGSPCVLILVCEAESLLDRQNQRDRHRFVDGGVHEAHGALHPFRRARARERRRAACADGKTCGAHP